MKSIAAAFIATIFSNLTVAQPIDKTNRSLSKTTTNDHVVKMQTSNVEYYFNNTGQGATDPKAGRNLGFYFPAGSGKSVVYADGFIWSGFIQLNDTTQDLRAGGATYTTGLQAGIIVENGKLGNGFYQAPVADAPAKSDYKVYSIYRDWRNLPDSDPLKSQYKSDYENWPKNQGAPMNVDGTPKFNGDFTSFFVSNDMSTSRTNQLYGSKPMGLEIQTTIWANDRNLGADQIIYFKKKIINKSGLLIKDFYVSIWSDQDLGDAGDDFVGVDTSLGLAFTYNGDEEDSEYKIPPAHGYLWFDREKQSSFFYYRQNGLHEDPPYPLLPKHINSLQRGYTYFGSPLTTNNGTPTLFQLSGDPVSQTGDLDGVLYSAYDRRILYSFGPFQIGVGDSIEISYASLVAQGNSRLHSITKLRELANKAKKIFANNFELNKYPRNPIRSVLKSTPMDRKIKLSWEDGSKENESLRSAGFRFEGYKIYQYKTPNERILIDYFDVVNNVGLIQDSVAVFGGWELQTVATGSNSGIQQSILISTDKFRNEPLINGFEYQFGVSAVYVRPDSINGQEIWPDVFDPKTKFPLHFEVPVSSILSAKPMHNHEWGSGYWYSGDTLTFIKNGNFSNLIKIIVADPNVMDQSDFKIEFVNDSGKVRWKLKNLTNLTDSPIQDLGFSGRLDAFWLEIGAINPGMIDFQITKNASGILDPPSYGAFAFNASGFPGVGPYQTNGTSPMYGNFNADRPSSTSQVSGQQWGIHASLANTVFTYSTFVDRSTQYTGGFGEPDQGLASIVPDDYEIRFTGGDETAVLHSTSNRMSVPFQIWNTKGNSDPSDDFRVVPDISDNGDGVYGLVKADHPVSGSDNDPYTDPIYMIEPLDRTPGEVGFNAFDALRISNPGAIDGQALWAYKDLTSNTKPALMRLVFVGLNAGSVSAANYPNNIPENKRLPEPGTIFKIVTSKPATIGNYVSFTTIGKSISKSREGENPGDFVLYENYPNPFNPETKIEVHLKHDAKVNLTIYDVLGREVNVLVNDFVNAGRLTKTWNGTNKNGIPVASGVYFYKVEIKSNNGLELFRKTNKMILLK